MSDLRELRQQPEPFRTRPDEPDPVRAFTGYFNGNHNLDLYRAQLVRYKWNDAWQAWMMPDPCWGVTLCDHDAYPYRWVGNLANPNSGSPSYKPEVADMRLCQACEKVLKEMNYQGHPL